VWQFCNGLDGRPHVASLPAAIAGSEKETRRTTEFMIIRPSPGFLPLANSPAGRMGLQTVRRLNAAVSTQDPARRQMACRADDRIRIDLEVPVEIADRAGLAEMFAPQRRDGMALHQALDLALGIALPARAGPSRGGPSRIQSVCSS